jgi:hypothetical protein
LIEDIKASGYDCAMNIKQSFDSLLADVCIRLGFCDYVWDHLPSEGALTPASFASAVFSANGDSEPNEFRVALEDAFETHMKCKSFDIDELREDCDLVSSSDLALNENKQIDGPKSSNERRSYNSEEQYALGLEVMKRHATVLQALADNPVDHSKSTR